MFNLTSINFKKKKKEKNKESYFIVKSQEDFKETKNHFVQFLIDDQPQYANLNRIEIELTEQNNNLLKTINNNIDTINKKKLQLKQINEIIQNSLIHNYKFGININKETKDDTKEIKKMKEKIESLSFSLQIYEGIINDLKKEKEGLLKKRKEESRNLEDAEKQLDKFKIIQRSVQREERQKKSLLRNLNMFQFRSEQLINDEMNKKKQKFAALEYKLNQIKQDIEYFNSKFTMLKRRQKKFINLIADQNNKNEKICYDKSMIIQDYLMNKLKINIIYHQMKFKTIEPILRNFKRDNLKYNTLSLNYNCYLKELTDLRSELSYYERELREIKHQQIIKNMKDNINKDEDYLSFETLENKFKEVEIFKNKNEIKEEDYFHKDIILKSNLNVMIKYDKDISRIQINQLINSNFSITMENLNNNNYGFLTESIKRFYNNYDISYEHLLHFLNDKVAYTMKDYRVFLTIFIKFQRKILNTYFNFYSALGKEKKGKIKSDFINIISTMFTRNQLENIIKNRLNLYNEKVQIKKIANDEIFKIQQKKKEERLFGNSGKISITSLLNSFISTNYKDKDTYFRFKSKFPLYLKKYTNEFVNEIVNDPFKKKKEKNENDDSLIEKTQRSDIDKQIKFSDRKNLNNKVKKEKILIQSVNENDSDSDFDGYNFYVENYEKKNKVKTKTNFFSKQKDNKYKRMNELYLLQRKLYNKYEEQIYDEINENYHKRKNERFYRALYDDKYYHFSMRNRNRKKMTIDLRRHLNFFKKAKTIINDKDTNDDNKIDELTKFQRTLTITFNNDNPINSDNNEEIKN